MERLTECKSGIVGLKECFDECKHPISGCDCICVHRAFVHLDKYEDTGLTPEGIVSLRKRLAVVTAERDAAIEDMKKIAKKSQQSNCDFCNKKKCIGCHVEDNFEWRGKVEE